MLGHHAIVCDGVCAQIRRTPVHAYRFNGLSGSPDTRLAQGFVGELEPEFAQRLIGSVAYHQVRLGRIKVAGCVA